MRASLPYNLAKYLTSLIFAAVTIGGFKMSLTRIPRTTLAVLAILALFNCKKLPQGNDLKTLQDYASNSASIGNSCRGAQTPSQDLLKRTIVNGRNCQETLISSTNPGYQTCETIRTTLTAVPTAVQQAYTDLGGSILATERAPSVCGAMFSDKNSPQFTPESERQKVAGCVMHLSGSAVQPNVEGSNKLVMMINNNEADIKHNIVRTFGYFFIQFVPQLREAKDAQGKFVYNFDINAPVTNAQLTLKQQLSNRFYIDMVELEHAKSASYNIDNLTAQLGKTGPAKIRANIAAKREDLLSGKANVYEGLDFALDGETSTAEMIRIRTERNLATVFAEGFDSWNCTAEIAADTRTTFRNVADYYQLVNDAVISRAEQISMNLRKGSANPAATSHATNGFALSESNIQQVTGVASNTVAATNPLGQMSAMGPMLLSMLSSLQTSPMLNGLSGFAQSPLNGDPSQIAAVGNSAGQDSLAALTSTCPNCKSGCPGGANCNCGCSSCQAAGLAAASGGCSMCNGGCANWKNLINLVAASAKRFIRLTPFAGPLTQ